MDFIQDHLIISSLIISLVIQAIFFVFAYLNKTDKFTDLSYGISFVILSIIGYFSAPQGGKVKLLLLLVVSIWGLRLAGYLFYRVIKIKRDKRFDGIRENFLRFASFWFLQGISIWIILLPVLVVFQKHTVDYIDFENFNNSLNRYVTIDPLSELSFEWLFFIGVMISFIGIFIETTSDIQKFNFKMNPQNKNKWTDVGFWKYLRHPNYLGEILMWIGIFIACVSYLQGTDYISIISPLYITFLLLFVTGIPTIEKRHDKKFQGNEKYQEYKRQTKRIIPGIY